MSFMDKLKAMFSGGSADDHAGHDHTHDHDHAGHDHSAHDDSHEPAAPPLPDEDESRPA